MDCVPRETRKVIFRLCFIWALVVGSWFVMLVASPLILVDILGQRDAADWQGLLTATTALSGTVLCGFSGYLSDRYGRVEVIQPWIFITLLSNTCILAGDVTRNPYLLLVARLSAMSIPSTVLFAYLSDLVSGSALLEAYGYVGGTVGISSLITSVLCSVIGKYYGRLYVLLLGVFMSLIAAVLTVRLNLQPPQKLVDVGGAAPVTVEDPEANAPPQWKSGRISMPSVGGSDKGEDSISSTSLPSDTPPSSHGLLISSYDRSGLVGKAKTLIGRTPSTAATPRKGLTFESFVEAAKYVLRDPTLRNTTLAYALLRVASVNTNLMYVLFVRYRLGWGIFDVSLVLGLTAFLGVLWQIVGIKYVIRKDKVLPMFIVTLLLFPAVMVGYALCQTSAQMYAISILGAVTTLSFSIFTTRITTLSSESKMAGMALGVGASIQNLLEIGFALFFGKLLAWSISTYDAQDYRSGIPFLVNAVLFVVVLLIVLWTDARYPRSREVWRAMGITTDE